MATAGSDTPENRPGPRGRDAAGMRRHNLRAVLRHLHLHGPTSRPELCAVTGLTRSAIGDLVGELLARELVREQGGALSGGRGRPPLVVTPHEQTHVLAVAVEVDTISIGRVGLGGVVSEQDSVPHEYVAGDPSSSLDQLTEMLRRWASKSTTAPLAIGIAVPGIVAGEDGTIVSAPNLAWQQVRLGAELQRSTGLSVPITIANEARLAGLAEHRRGAGRDCADLVYVSAEVGVGGGVISGGRTLTGASGYAGEIGHMVTRPDGRACRCGGHGCWETEIGADALLRHAGITAPPDRHAALTELLRQADEGRPDAVAALRALCPAVAIGLANLINVFNPQRVLFGGLLTAVVRHARNELHGCLRAVHGLRAYPADVRGAELGELAPLLGAAEAAVDSVLEQL